VTGTGPCVVPRGPSWTLPDWEARRTDPALEPREDRIQLRLEPLHDLPRVRIRPEVKSVESQHALRWGQILGLVDLDQGAPCPQEGVLREGAPTSEIDSAPGVGEETGPAVGIVRALKTPIMWCGLTERRTRVSARRRTLLGSLRPPR
jgi:hypothetical protein